MPKKKRVPSYIKRIKALDYMKNFLMKIDIKFNHASAAKDVIEYIDDEMAKNFKSGKKYGKFDSDGEMRAAMHNEIYNKKEWDLANGVVETEEELEEKIKDLEPMVSEHNPSDSAIEKRMKEMEEGKKK